MMDLNMVANNGLVLVPLILAVVQGIKLLIDPKYHKWAFLLSMVIGIIFSYLFANDTESIKVALGQGIIAGLSASGLYSGSKATMTATEPRYVDNERID